MVSVDENGHGHASSNTGRDCFHFILLLHYCGSYEWVWVWQNGLLNLDMTTGQREGKL